MPSYAYERFPYRRAPELDGGRRGEAYPVAIVGAGPVGLSAAIDLATRGVPSVVLDDNDVVSTGSRAICWAKRTLEIFDRLGVGERMVAKGVTWKIGRFYEREREIYAIDLLPEPGHKMPAFINLQQYYVEQYLVERAADFPGLIDLRWKNKVVGIEPGSDGARLAVETPDGAYGIEAGWVLAADGARSPLRSMLGLSFEGQLFEEKFLIIDVRLAEERPNERHFWFHPVFDRGESVLLHRQPDDVYRIDFQLGPEADGEAERAPERVRERVEAVFGPGVAYELEWASVYSFRCARMERFVHGRVVFVGDSAHVVSPFGARGGNGGIQDVDNLGWKLALAVRGEAPPALVESYEAERGRGADENILNSARTTRFMTPKSLAERAFRDGVLALAADHPFARKLVNGGRLSRPCSLAGLPLQSDDACLEGPAETAPGAPCPDAPVRDAEGRPGWLLDLVGEGFTLIAFADSAADIPDLTGSQVESLLVVLKTPSGAAPVAMGRSGSRDPRLEARTTGGRASGRRSAPPQHDDGKVLVVEDAEGLLAERYGGRPGVTYLIRPDQHVAARFERFDLAAITAAQARATAVARAA